MLGGIDVRLAFTYVSNDERWVKKLLIGALFALGPVLIVGAFVLTGYLIEIIRRVTAGSSDPLPEWSGNLGTFLKQGFPAAVGVFIWMAPFFAVWFGAFWLVLGDEVTVSIEVQALLGIAFMVLTNLYAAAVLPSAIGRYAAKPRLRSMFEFGAIFASIRRIGVGAIGVWVIQLIMLGLTFVSIWALVAIVFLTAYSAMVFGHSFGQAVRLGNEPSSGAMSSRPT